MTTERGKYFTKTRKNGQKCVIFSHKSPSTGFTKAFFAGEKALSALLFQIIQAIIEKIAELFFIISTTEHRMMYMKIGLLLEAFAVLLRYFRLSLSSFVFELVKN